MNLADVTHVVAQGWIRLECGAQEWTPFDDPEADGFSVYLRVPTPETPNSPYDIREEQDFSSPKRAELYAELLARHHGDVHVEYN